MNNLQHLASAYLDSRGSRLRDDQNTPNIIRNVERMAEKYRKFLDSEISKEQASQNAQAEKVKKLQGKDSNYYRPKR